VHKNPIRKLILVLSIVPITILANFVRVLTLVLGAYYLGIDTIEGLFHDVTGIALFMIALLLFFFLDSGLVGAGLLMRKAGPWAAMHGGRLRP
jgi:exosortase/archaeosortase family protein